MSLYIIEDDDGNVLDSYGEFDKSVINATLYDEPIGAELDVDECGGRVVELFEKPAPVVVSEEQGRMLHNFVAGLTDWANVRATMGHGDVLKAIKCGWEVEKPKRYNVKVPHTQEAWYYQYGDTDLLTISPADKELRGKFTKAEIEHYGLQDCEKEEVTDDEQ